MEDQFNRIVPVHATNYIYCFGGIAFVLFIILAITGILLAVYYQPTPEGAYQSVFEHLDPRAVRLVDPLDPQVGGQRHGPSGRDPPAAGVLDGRLQAPREMNWVTGVVLLLVTLGFGFTGYLLPWDQKAYWATKVGTDIAGSTPVLGHFLLVSLRGGEHISGATLGRFFTLHVLVLPVVIILSPRRSLLDDPPARHLGTTLGGVP